MLLDALFPRVFCTFPEMTCGAGVSPAQAAGTAAPQNRGIILGQILWFLVIYGGVFFLSFAVASAQLNDNPPAEMSKVYVKQNVGAQIPLDSQFTDSRGNPVTLKEIFDGRLPTLLTMNYSDCPMLCSLQLNAMLDALKNMKWNIGEQFQIVTVSIDPLETSERAGLTKEKYLRLYGRPVAEQGWRFITCRKEATIKKLAETIGFGYTYVPETRQYAHPTPLMICTPTGKVSRYLDMKQYDPQTIKFSLMEASEGKVGTAADLFFLSCFHYDAERGRYAPEAMRFMQLGGGLTALVFAGVLVRYWVRDARKKREQQVEVAN
jgi:protein SCO1